MSEPAGYGTLPTPCAMRSHSAACLNIMTVAKICMLIFATGAQLYAMTPPNAKPNPKERLKPTGLERSVTWGPILMKVFAIANVRVLYTLLIIFQGILCACTFAELAFATGHESVIQKPLASILIRSHSPPDFDPAVLSPALIVGSFLSIVGTAIRAHCYRTLGRLFTFELSIRQGHKLLTSGPYSIVRHPSYAGGLLVFLGVLLCHFHIRSWLVSSSGLFPSSGQATKWTLAFICAALSSLLYAGLGARIQKEEKMLEEHFGDQWRSYTKKVPYRLVPWLY